MNMCEIALYQNDFVFSSKLLFGSGNADNGGLDVQPNGEVMPGYFFSMGLCHR